MVPYGYFPDGILLIRKVCSVNPSVTLANAEFKVTYADGTLIGDSNGIYHTDENGEIRIEGLKPGKSVIVTETRAPAGFILDTQSQTVQVKEGRTVSLTFKNQPRGKLIIQKRDSQTNKPLPGAEFRVTTAAGCEVGLDGVIGTATLTQNGLFTTDSNGEIRISNLAPGAYVLTEVKAPAGYVMDTPSTNVVIGTNGDTQTVIIKNSKAGTLVIDKRDSVTGKPLAGVTFKVTTSTGEYVPDANGQISSNGLYFTDKDGKITINGVVGTLVVTETATIPGYTIDEATRTQTVVVNPNDTQTLHFTNTPSTTLIIRKFIEGTANEPLAGVGFKVVDGSGAAVGPDDGVYYTDHAGEIVLDGIEPGTTVIAREIKTVDGFVLDGTPQDIKIEAGRVQQLTFWNKRAGTLLIEKLDSVTKAPLKGAQFKVTYADGRVVDTEGGKLSSNGIYFTDSNGQIKITNVTGTIVVTEEKAPDGYVIGSNDKSQTVVVNPQDTQTLRFYNDPLCSLTITKLDSISGKPVPNTEFTVKDGNGSVLGRYTTGKDGTVTVTGLVPGSTVVVSESRVPEGYVLNTTPQTIIVRSGSNNLSTGNTSGGTGGSSGGNISGGGNDLTFENDPKTTLVIQKYAAGTNNEPLAGVEFLVTDSSGAAVGPNNGYYTTDKDGRITINNLEPGITVTARETRPLAGYVLDGKPQSIKIKTGEAQSMTFWNQKAGNLIINKVDGIDKHPLAGVRFKITYADGSNVDQDGGKTSTNGIYVTDANGQIKISGVTGTVMITEIETIDGYYIDEKYRTQTVQINANDTQTVTVYNVPTQALVIQKFETGSKDKPLAGVEFLVTDSDGTVIGPNNGIYKTDQFGRITIKDLTPGTVITARETKCLDGYVLDSSPKASKSAPGKFRP